VHHERATYICADCPCSLLSRDWIKRLEGTSITARSRRCCFRCCIRPMRPMPHRRLELCACAPLTDSCVLVRHSLPRSDSCAHVPPPRTDRSQLCACATCYGPTAAAGWPLRNSDGRVVTQCIATATTLCPLFSLHVAVTWARSLYGRPPTSSLSCLRSRTTVQNGLTARLSATEIHNHDQRIYHLLPCTQQPAMIPIATPLHPWLHRSHVHTSTIITTPD
jgi:hypothetical protein